MLALLPSVVHPSVVRLHTMGEHLIVLCHGLNGDHRELACLERAINEFPDCKVLNSKENNGGIFSSFISIFRCSTSWFTYFPFVVVNVASFISLLASKVFPISLYRVIISF